MKLKTKIKKLLELEIDRSEDCDRIENWVEINRDENENWK